MSADPHGEEDFVFDYPVYVLSAPNHMLMAVEVPGVGKLVPFFTDEDLAVSFVRGRQVDDATIREVPSAEILDGLIAATQVMGATHVLIDPSDDPRRRSRYNSVGGFLRRGDKRTPAN